MVLTYKQKFLSKILNLRPYIYIMSAKQYKLSDKEKLRMSNRINYFRTMPDQVRKSVLNLETGFNPKLENFVNHEMKSVLVHGRIMILNTGT